MKFRASHEVTAYCSIITLTEHGVCEIQFNEKFERNATQRNVSQRNAFYANEDIIYNLQFIVHFSVYFDIIQTMKFLLNVVVLVTTAQFFVHSCPYLLGGELGRRNLQLRNRDGNDRNGGKDGDGGNRGGNRDGDGNGGNNGGNDGDNRGNGGRNGGNGGNNGGGNGGNNGGNRRTRMPSSAPAGIPPPPPDTCTTPIVNRANICSAFQQVSTLFDAALSNPNIALPSEIFASAVRVVFHDAGEVDVRSPNDLLGSDGCLSSDFNNEGLVIPTAVVQRIFEPMYREVCDRISRADFWVLLGKLTLDRAITPALPVPFHYGRVDNNECEAGNRRLPSAEGDLTEISRVFVDQMGLTMDDAGIYYIVCILHYIIYSVYITLYYI